MENTYERTSQNEETEKKNDGHTNKPDTEQFEALRHLSLTGVELNKHDGKLGRGEFGTVYRAMYNGTPHAAKEFDPFMLREYLGKQYIIEECLLHSRLNHNNIVKMLGVYTPPDASESTWPVLVMELMEYPLAKLTMNDEELFIPMYVKLSILQDISAGLCYLHTMNPPILHCDLSPYNILLTADLVAKLANFGEAAKVAKGHLRLNAWRLHGWWSRYDGFHCDVEWPEKLYFKSQEDDYYTLSTEVFSFGCIACHVITQKWHTVRSTLIGPPSTYKEYIHEISEGPIKQLIVSCVMDKQKKRPPITVVRESITDIVTSKC